MTPTYTFAATALTELSGIGSQQAERLRKLGLRHAEDLLWHLPLRYRDLTRVTPIASLILQSDALIEGQITHVSIQHGRRRSLACTVRDASGGVTLRFFYFSRAQQEQLAQLPYVRAWGEVRRGVSGYELYHPEYRLHEQQQAPALAEHLTPIYPASEGLQQTRLRQWIAKAWTLCAESALQELLPPTLLPAPLNQWQLEQALRYLHHPPADADVYPLQQGSHPAQQRLAFEELVAHHLTMLCAREQVQQQAAQPLAGDPSTQAEFLQRLPFRLTEAQQRVLDEITADLRQDKPMLRLVQGDVGSGKTVVAALACLQALACGQQACVMAPTEILSRQHYEQFTHWFEPLGYRCVWLSGSVKGRARKAVLEQLADGSAPLAIGTHALFQDDVHFKSLALVVTDEQHRFGVRQRLALTQRNLSGFSPHQLTMTATPIPRTLAMSAYADMDSSRIDQRPPGRTPIQTVLIDSARRADVISRLAQNCAEGKQAYWVCTLIETSEQLNCQAAEVTWQELAEQLPQLKIGLVHGRLKPLEKDERMRAFKRGELDVLVATTVIEVGVDVPNASIMIIENPERLGLAQLHQLRGRVGRGSAQSFCLLLYSQPLSLHARQRLATLRETEDGFAIAEKDLQLRGPGEFLGTRQTGLLELRAADLLRDAALLPAARHSAERLLAHYPERVQALIDRWLRAGTDYART